MAFKSWSGVSDYRPQARCQKCGERYHYWKDEKGQPHFYCMACGYIPGQYVCSISAVEM
jgi:peptide subunit release factor 1 (eRF1)